MKPDRNDRAADGRETMELRFLFVRLVWAAIGPAVMAGTFFLILQHGTGWATVLDAIYLTALVSTVGCRWWDFFRGDPRTTTGEIATVDQIRNYSIAVIAIALVAWLAANLLGNHFFA